MPDTSVLSLTLPRRERSVDLANVGLTALVLCGASAPSTRTQLITAFFQRGVIFRIAR